MSGKMVGKSMVFYFKYGLQLDQYCDLEEEDQKKVIKMGSPDLEEKQLVKKIEMINEVITKANAQAKVFFNELAQEAENILKQFCNTDICKMTIKSDWESYVSLFPKSYKNKNLLSVHFCYEEDGPEVKKSGHPQLEICFTTEGEDEEDERLYKAIEKIYNGKLETLCNWRDDWGGDYNFETSLLRVPVYHDGTQDFQVEKEQLFNAILAPLKMLKQKDIDTILEVMY